jgi:hypothetical protein
LGEDELEARQEGEEDDVDDCQVEGEEGDDGLEDEQLERAVEIVQEPVDEPGVLDFKAGFVVVVAGDAAQLRGLPFEKDGRVGLGKEEEEQDQDEAGPDQRDPFTPAP